MDMSKYLIIPLITVSALACRQKISQPDNKGALKLTDSTLIMKTEPADPAKNAPSNLDAVKATDHTIIMKTEAANANRAVTSQQLIVPGKGIGKISIDESMETVFNLLGKPDSSDAAMGSALAVWYAGHKAAGYKTSIFSRHNYTGKDEIFQHVRKILVTSPYFKTKEGIGPGSNSKDIKKHYSLKPGTSYITKGKRIDIYNDVSKGISFEIDSATNICVGIVVQKTNDANGTYLNMH